MKISTKGRYSLRLMIELAEQKPGEYMTLNEVARKQNISMKYLEQIVIPLSKAGYLSGVKGPKGGYALKKAPEEYGVGDILRVTEKDLVPVQCLVEDKNECDNYNRCTTIVFWEGLHRTINNYIDSFTLQDLINQYKER